MEARNCVNCGLSSRRERRYMISDLGQEITSRLDEWLPDRRLANEDHVCNQCLLAVQRSFEGPQSAQRQVGHHHVCGWCGKSILHVKSNALLLNTAERQLVEQRMSPQQLSEEARICHSCSMKAKRHIQRQSLEDSSRDTDNIPSTSNDDPIQIQDPPRPSTSHEEPIQTHTPLKTLVTLPNYKHTKCTAAHCVYPGCSSTEKLRLPKVMRIRMLMEYKLYIPYSSRICSEHIVLYNWDEIIRQTEFLNTFTPEQIEDMLNLQKNMLIAFNMNLENIETWSSHLVHYWLGHSVSEINEIINQCPSLTGLRNAKSLIGIYLMKLRTGDSNERLGTLLQLPPTTIRRHLKKARKILTEEFLPRNLGINCLPRNELLQKNLLIPNGLFGGTENNKAIVLADATYIYIQKSTNYNFQKKTYSLHKYQNLVKPFLMVATNGHILDVWGPFSATESDADIMKRLFADANGPLSHYFRPGDVLILDRGFRDAMNSLRELNYEPHMWNI